MKFFGNKTLLFIEPCLSSHLLVLRAKEKRFNTLVISANSDQRALPEEVVNASSSFFQVDTNDDLAVLDLVGKIAQKFHIDGVIPGVEYYVPLTAKVAMDLKKPGLTPEVALGVHRKDVMRDTLKAHNIPIPQYRKVQTEKELEIALKTIGYPCILKPVDCAGSVNVMGIKTFEEAFHAFQEITAHEGVDPAWGNRVLQRCALVEEYIQGKEYSIEGFSKDNMVSIVSITENLSSPETDSIVVGRIVPAEIEPNLFAIIEPYVKKVISSLKFNYAPFHAVVRLSERGPLLMGFSMRLADNNILKLIGYATGIDYYENTLKLFSGQPLSLQRTQRLNAGMTFFYHPEAIEILRDNPYVREIKVYEGHIPGSKHEVGHAIFLHEDYNVLKQQMLGLSPHPR